MKLHLPFSLLAAVTMACVGAGRAYANSLTTQSTTVNSTVESVSAGKTYSGYIFTFLPSTDTATSGYTADGQGYNIAGHNTDSSLTTYFAQFKEDGTSGDAIGSRDTTELPGGRFWHTFCSSGDTTGSTHGHTLRLASNSADMGGKTEVKIGGDFTPFTLGGLIVENTNVDWVVGRHSGNAVFKLVGNEAVNLTIASNTTLKSSQGMTVETGGAWEVSAGKTLTIDTGSSYTTTIKSGQSVALSRLSGTTDAYTVIKNTLALESGAALSVGNGMSLTVEGSIKLASGASGATITVAGSLSGALESGSVVLNGGSYSGTQSGGSVLVSGGSYAGTLQGGELSMEGGGRLGNFELNGGTLVFNAPTDSTDAWVTGTGNITLSGGELSLADLGTMQLGDYTLLSTSGTLSWTQSSLTFNGHEIEAGEGNGVFYYVNGENRYTGTLSLGTSEGNNTLLLNLANYSGQQLNWGGGSGTWSLGGEGWGNNSFANHDTVTFGANSTEGSTDTVTISGELMPAFMNVEGKYIFNVEDDAVDGLSGAGSLEVSGTATINGTHSAWHGNTEVLSGGQLSLTLGSHLLNHLAVNKGGVLNIVVPEGNSQVVLYTETFTPSGAGTVNIDTNGRTWAIEHASHTKDDANALSRSAFTGDIVLSGGGTLRLGGDTGGIDQAYTVSEEVLGTSGSITLSGANTTLEFQMTQKGTATISKTIILGDGTTLKEADGNYIFENVQLQAGAAATLHYDWGKTIEVKSLIGRDEANNLTGELKITHGSEENTSDNLKFTETLAVDKLTVQAASSQVNITAANAQIGTLTQNGSETTTALRGAGFSVGNINVTAGTVEIAAAPASTASTTFTVASAGTVKLTNIAGVQGSISGSGTLSLVNNSARSLESFVQNLTGLTTADSWTGTVRLSGTGAVQLINLNLVGNANSAVEFNGAQGYLHFANNSAADAEYAVYNPAMILTGTGSNGAGAALTLNNGASDNKYEFGGAVSGEGDFVISLTGGSNRPYFKFSGDVSGWNGALKTTNGSITAYVTYTGDALAINNAVTSEAGTLNVTYQNIKDEAMEVRSTISGAGTTNLKVTQGEVVFKAADAANTEAASVTANDVTVSGGTMKVEAVAFTAADLLVSSGGAVDTRADMQLETVTVNSGGSLAVNGGTLSVSSSFTSAEGVTVASGAELVLGADVTLDLRSLQFAAGAKLTLSSGTLDFTPDEASAAQTTLSFLQGTLDTGAAMTMAFDPEPVVDESIIGKTYATIDVSGWADNSSLLAQDDSQTALFTGVASSAEWDEGQRAWVYFGENNANNGLYNLALNEISNSVFLAARVVPEPTTATLSLLALTALCARRRRRA